MLRTVFSLAAGLAVSAMAIVLLEGASHALFPPQDGASLHDGAAMRAITGRIPLGAKIGMLIAWAAGVFAGGSLAAWIARRGAWPAWTIGAVFLAVGVWTMAMIPHPLWMWAAAIAGTGAAAYLAGRMFGAKAK